jgi:outer membrane lipoprotein-sorting protein
MTRWTLRSLLVLGLAVAAGAADARALARDKLPRGADLMDKFVEATGGKAAYGKLKSREAEGVISFLGKDGTIRLYQAEPNKMRAETDLKGVGKIEEGVNGQVAWELNPLTGPSLKKGSALAEAERNARMDADVNWHQRYKDARTVGAEAVEGKPCYKVELTTPEGKKETRYFDEKTGLLLKYSHTIETMTGEEKVDTYPSEYKKVDGLLLPYSLKHVIRGQELRMTFTKIRHNVQIPAERFALPAEVRKLAEKKGE